MQNEQLSTQIIDAVKSVKWDAKEWSRQIMVNQRILEDFIGGRTNMDDEQMAYLFKLTNDAIANPRPSLMRFKTPIIIGSCIHKGGSGKTTCSVALADELAVMGYNVLFIDSDSQMDATSTLLPEGSDGKELFNALAVGSDIRTQICETTYDRLDIVPSSSRMSSIEALLMSQAQGYGSHPEQT